jgi:hypothetical protein
MRDLSWQTAGDERIDELRRHGFRVLDRVQCSRSNSVTHSLLRMRRAASQMGGSFVFRERIAT